MMFRQTLPFIVLTLLHGSIAIAADAQPPHAVTTFSHVAHIFPPNCHFCHGWNELAKTQGYFMGTYAGLIEGSYNNIENKRLIIPGDAEHSPLVERIEGRIQPQMPYYRPPLSSEEIALIRRWIDDGAPADALTTLEHEVVLNQVPVRMEGETLWLSCRAPKDGQNISLRVKIVDDATGKVVAYDWPTSERDLNGRWSQWGVVIPAGSMRTPGTVGASLCCGGLARQGAAGRG
jgi:hypothetical protein